MKIPDPIIEPTTRVVELKSPSEGTSPDVDGMDAEAGAACRRELVGFVTWNVFTGIETKSLLLCFISL
jgi:hypothetical protein